MSASPSLEGNATPSEPNLEAQKQPQNGTVQAAQETHRGFHLGILTHANFDPQVLRDLKRIPNFGALVNELIEMTKRGRNDASRIKPQ